MAATGLPAGIIKNIIREYVESFRVDPNASILPLLTSCKALHDATIPILYSHIEVQSGRPMHSLRQTNHAHFQHTRVLKILPCRCKPAQCRVYCRPPRDKSDHNLYASFVMQLSDDFGGAKEPSRYLMQQADVRVTLDTLCFETPYHYRHTWTRPIFRAKNLIYHPKPLYCYSTGNNSPEIARAMVTQFLPDYDPLLCEMDISQPLMALYDELTECRWPYDWARIDVKRIINKFNWHLAFMLQGSTDQRWLDSMRLHRPIKITCRARPWLFAEQNDRWRKLYTLEGSSHKWDEEARRVAGYSIFNFQGEPEAYGPPEVLDVQFAIWFFTTWVEHPFERSYTWRPTSAIETPATADNPLGLAHAHPDPVSSTLRLPGDDIRFATNAWADWGGEYAKLGRPLPKNAWWKGADYDSRTAPREYQRRRPLLRD